MFITDADVLSGRCQICQREGRGGGCNSHPHPLLRPPQAPLAAPAMPLSPLLTPQTATTTDRPLPAPHRVHLPSIASPSHWHPSGGLASRLLSADWMPPPTPLAKKRTPPAPLSQKVSAKSLTPQGGSRAVAEEIKPSHRATPKPVEGLCRSRSIAVGSPAHKRSRRKKQRRAVVRRDAPV